jgi:hypothetical protein
MPQMAATPVNTGVHAPVGSQIQRKGCELRQGRSIVPTQRVAFALDPASRDLELDAVPTRAARGDLIEQLFQLRFAGHSAVVALQPVAQGVGEAISRERT